MGYSSRIGTGLLLLVALGCNAQPPERPDPATGTAKGTSEAPRLLGWCCPTADSAIMSLIARYEATPPAERAPEVAMVGYRHGSGFETQTQLVIRDSASWRTTWATLIGSHSPKPPLPAVDFSREMLVVAGMGTRSSGGYSVGVDSVFLARDTVFFRVRETSPGVRCGTTAALTSPVGLARVERTDRPIGFVISEVISECP